jgi:hypothetical protein
MRIVAAVGAIAATTLVVAACGGGSDGADAGAVATKATATAPVDPAGRTGPAAGNPSR